MLVRTPPHAPTESLLGYVLRLSETNGYETPWHILKLAGFAQSEMATAGFPVAKLASILGRSPEALSGIAYVTNTGGQRSFMILGHQLGGGLTFNPLRLQRPALCPECASDRGYIEAFFDINLALACPVHGRKLLSRCESCGQQLSHFRPGLLVCRCGAPLTGQTRPAVSNRVVALMAVLKANLERTDFPASVSVAGLPVNSLLGLPLRLLLVHLPKFGRFNRAGCAPDSLEAIDGVAEALEDWPQGFHRFLDQHGQSKDAPTFHKRFRQFSEMFFGVPETRANFDWLHSEFLEFGLTHGKGSYVDLKAIPGRNHERRVVPLREFSRRTGHDGRSLEAWHKKGLLNITQLGTGSNSRYVVDAETIALPPRPERTEILGKRQAAAWLNIPVSVLECLRELGHFHIRHQLSFRHGYHKADLMAFMAQLIALSPPINRAALPNQAISLKRMLCTLRLHGAEQKTQLVIRYLHGDLQSVGRTGETTDDIYFDKGHVTALATASRTVAAGGALTQVQAAQLIGCDVQVVTGLLVCKHLKSVRCGGFTRIDARSAERFAQRHVSLAMCATDWATSSQRLIRLCRQERVRVLRIPHPANGESPFIRRSDAQLLHDTLADESRCRYTQHPRQTRPDPVARLHEYLENLTKNSQPLPWRGGQPNKVAIARACGFDRDVFYSNAEAIRLLRAFDRKERVQRTAAGLVVDRPIARLQIYLDQLKRTGESLPARGGKPNKIRIAEDAGVDRDLFYRSTEATRMLETFSRRKHR